MSVADYLAALFRERRDNAWAELVQHTVQAETETRVEPTVRDDTPKCVECGLPVEWHQTSLRRTDASGVMHLACFKGDA